MKNQTIDESVKLPYSHKNCRVALAVLDSK